MVFGQAARLPGTFFFTGDTDTNDTLQPVAEMQLFQENMRHVHHSVRDQQITNPYVSDDLFTVEEVLVRDDGNKAPLSKLYAGPFAVIAKTDKYFTLDTDRGLKNISIDRLKPFYRLVDDTNFDDQRCDATNHSNSNELDTSDDDDGEHDLSATHSSGYFLRPR